MTPARVARRYAPLLVSRPLARGRFSRAHPAAAPRDSARATEDLVTVTPEAARPPPKCVPHASGACDQALNHDFADLRSLEFLFAHFSKGFFVLVEQVGESCNLAPAERGDRNARSFPRREVGDARVVAARRSMPTRGLSWKAITPGTTSNRSCVWADVTKAGSPADVAAVAWRIPVVDVII